MNSRSFQCLVYQGLHSVLREHFELEQVLRWKDVHACERLNQKMTNWMNLNCCQSQKIRILSVSACNEILLESFLPHLYPRSLVAAQDQSILQSFCIADNFNCMFPLRENLIYRQKTVHNSPCNGTSGCVMSTNKPFIIIICEETSLAK